MQNKIVQLMINTLHEGKKKNITGKDLFEYLGKEKKSIDDKVIDLIEDKKSIKNQPKAVIDAFTPFAKDVKVSVKQTEKQKSISIVSTVCKQEIIPFSTLSFRNIDFVSKIKKRESQNYTLFSKPIEDWVESDYSSLNSSFLKGL